MSRQYTGTAGKVTNCQVGVSLHLASDHARWRSTGGCSCPRPRRPGL
ncbi:transposase [Streptomyces vinaceus]